MGKVVRIFIACGSGIATSTVAEREIKRIAKQAGVKIRTCKGTIGEIQSKQYAVDAVFTTANYRKPLERPHLSVGGLVSGIKKDKIEKDVEALLRELLGE